MPIQPRAPMRRLNSRSWPDQDSARDCASRPAISRPRKSRTSARSVSASGQGGGGAKAMAVIVRVSSCAGDLVPEPVRAGFGQVAAEQQAPLRLRAELVAPGPQPLGVEMQPVLVGE